MQVYNILRLNTPQKAAYSALQANHRILPGNKIRLFPRRVPYLTYLRLIFQLTVTQCDKLHDWDTVDAITSLTDLAVQTYLEPWTSF